MDNKTFSMAAVMKFLMGAGIGLFLFMYPFSLEGEDGFNTPLSIATSEIDKLIGEYLPWLLTVIVCISALGAFYCYVVKPSFSGQERWLKTNFSVSLPYLITRLIAMAVALAVMFSVGPEEVISDDVGGTMLGLSQTLIALAITLSIALPMLTDTGLMEFAGIILKPLIRPLFKVPGRASLDLVASWLASSNTAVLITGFQYQKGYYTQREAATIMTNFSLVSIPFCMVVAETLQLNDGFPILYATVTLVGLILAVVGVRIWPLGTIPNQYLEKKNINEEMPANKNLLEWAFSEAIERNAKFRIKTAFIGGCQMAVNIVLDIIPIVIAWGVIGTLLVNQTPIFQILSYPMGWYMNVLGVQGAFEIAPQTLVGFIDMFIPALITSHDLPEQTRFLVAGISLVQIIYMTEVGSIITKSHVGLDIKKLFIIFLERTVIAIPIIVLITKFIYG